MKEGILLTDSYFGKKQSPVTAFRRATLFQKRAFVFRAPPFERRCRTIVRRKIAFCSVSDFKQSPVTAFRRATLFPKRAYVLRLPPF